MWYSQGTINATNNSATIVGSGTQFIANVRVGDGITIQGSQSLHEVVGIASNTQMTIRPAFTGTSGAGKQFACAPILGYDKDLSDAFNQLRLQFGDKLGALQPWAYAATANAALDALGFSASGKSVATGTPAQGRVGLGLGTAATRDVGTASGNVMPVGAFGLGGGGVLHPLDWDTIMVGGIYRSGGEPQSGNTPYTNPYGSTLVMRYAGGASPDLTSKIHISYAAADPRAYIQSIVSGPWRELLHTGNITKNPDGTLKASSPVINLYTDHHDLHNESQFGGIPVVTRKSKGVYEITGTLGLRSEGWYLDTPNDRNGNKYFNIEWTQNITPDAVDGIVDEFRDDIVVTIETFERMWNKETGMFDNGAPIDINELQDRFVQLRFNEIKVEHEELVDDYP